MIGILGVSTVLAAEAFIGVWCWLRWLNDMDPAPWVRRRQ